MSCTNLHSHVAALQAIGVGCILVDAPLRDHCYWKIGGAADILVEPAGAEQLSDLLRYVTEHTIAHVVVGDASNVLFADEGFRGVVIKTGRAMSGCRIEDNLIYAQAGIAVPRLARKAGAAGLTGLEHTVGIPGRLGGLVAMNGGSLQQGIGEVVRTVYGVDASGGKIELPGEACDFSYRHSVFLENPWIITDVVLELEQGERTDILRRMRDILRERRHKFPRRLPNCGSVFKNHPEIYEKFGPPGKVIEELGLKGFSVGDAQVSRQHANFIVNTGHARAGDVLELIKIIREKVHQKTTIWPECEVRYVSPSGYIQPAHLQQNSCT